MYLQSSSNLPNPVPAHLSLCSMVSAVQGVLVTCDIPVKEFLVFLDENQPTRFIINDLDETHLFVRTSCVSYLEKELDKLYEENQYSFIQ